MNWAQLQTWQALLGIIVSLFTLLGLFAGFWAVLEKLKDHSAQHAAGIAGLGEKVDRLTADQAHRNEVMAKVETALKDHMDLDASRFDALADRMEATGQAIDALADRMVETHTPMEREVYLLKGQVAILVGRSG